MAQTILRLPSVKACTGLSRSTIYLYIKDKTFPAPVRLGPRAVAWLSQEVDAVIAARAAGQSDDEVRTLVRLLMSQRPKLLADVLGRLS